MNNSFLHIYKTLCFSFSLLLSCFISWFYSRIFREVLLNSWFVNMPFLLSFLHKVNYRSNVYILLTPATTLSTSAIINVTWTDIRRSEHFLYILCMFIYLPVSWELPLFSNIFRDEVIRIKFYLKFRLKNISLQSVNKSTQKVFSNFSFKTIKFVTIYTQQVPNNKKIKACLYKLMEI